MPGKTFKITPKHRRLVKAFLNTGNWAESCRISGFSPQYAPELSKNPQITNLIRAGQERAGLSDKALEVKHVELLNCGERPVEGAMLRLAYQVKKKIGADPDAPVSDRVPNITIVMDAGNEPTDGKRRVQAHKPPNVSIQITD